MTRPSSRWWFPLVWAILCPFWILVASMDACAKAVDWDWKPEHPHDESRTVTFNFGSESWLVTLLEFRRIVKEVEKGAPQIDAFMTPVKGKVNQQ